MFYIRYLILSSKEREKEASQKDVRLSLLKGQKRWVLQKTKVSTFNLMGF